MHLTVEVPGVGRRDCWAEDGAALANVLADLGIDPNGSWNYEPGAPLGHGALVCPAEADQPATLGPGGWQLVALGGAAAGRVIALRSPDAPIRAGVTKRGRVVLSQRSPSEPIWRGQVRRHRPGTPHTEWRRLRRPARTAPATLLRTVTGELFVLLRGPTPQLGDGSPNTPKRSWRTVATTAVTALAMAGVMFAMTRNPIWALMPLIGAIATALPLLARTPRGPWTAGVVGLDPAATSPLAPGTVLELLGPPLAAAAMVRRFVAHAMTTADRLPSLSVPPAPEWAWTRFAPPAGPAGPDLKIEPVDRGYRLTVGAKWPATPGLTRPPGPASSHAAAATGARSGPAWAPVGSGPLSGIQRIVVRDAGLGLIAGRSTAGEALLAATLSPGTIEDQ
ncbi:MAG: hypothetical protein LBE08_12210, partial [Bifidobacteriaceae bacterium]|nr:hypothetical protein [Bifidobacteriaceae bacterium]